MAQSSAFVHQVSGNASAIQQSSAFVHQILGIPILVQGSSFIHTTTGILSLVTGGIVVSGPSTINGQETDFLLLTNWDTYTPVTSWDDVSPIGYFRTVGDILELRASIQINAGSTLSGPLTIDLPSGFTIDSNKLLGLVNFPPIGQAVALDISDQQFLIVVSIDAASNKIVFENVDPTEPFIWDTDDALEIFVTIPTRN